MPKTPDEIKKGLECCLVGCEWDNGCPYMGLFSECTEGLKSDALVLIQQLQAETAEKDARIQQLESRNLAMYNTILSVMHFVDKWLDCPDYDLDADLNGVDAVQRVVKAREIALQAIEQLEAERDAAVETIYEMAKCITEDVCEWCDGVECERLCMPHAILRPGFKWRGVQKEE